MIYSPSKNAFYPLGLRVSYEQAGTWPDDAVEITQEEYCRYGHSEPPEGMRRGADEHGRPSWVPIPPLDLDKLAAIKRAEIDSASTAALAQIRSNYPDYEQLSWERQEREARDGGGPLIQAIANARGLPIEDLISRIIAKADAYREAAGIVIGRRQALRDQIDAIAAHQNLTDDERRQALLKVEWSET